MKVIFNVKQSLFSHYLRSYSIYVIKEMVRIAILQLLTHHTTPYMWVWLHPPRITIVGAHAKQTMDHAAPRKVRKHFLTRYTVKNGISNLYILLKSALKMQEIPF